MLLKVASLLLLFSLFPLPSARSQTTGSTPAKPVVTSASGSSPTKALDYSTESYIIQKYATDITYAADGTGERLITVAVKVQSDAAVRQFGVLEFPYESRNEHVDFVYVRVRKPDGSVIATPDTDAQDQPAEVTRQAPFYSDIRDKQLPVKSLSVGDQLEYQVRQVRTVAAAPGHFWFVQNFVSNAVVLEETLSLSVPKQKYVQVESAANKPEIVESGDRKIYRWKTAQLDKTKVPDEKAKKPVVIEQPPSIAVTTFKSWEEVGRWYADLQKDRVVVSPAVQAKANDLIKGLGGAGGLATDEEKIAAIYTYVSTQYRYIGVAFGIGRYQAHTADDVMQNQYGDCKDKHTLLATLLKAAGYDAWPVLVGSQHVLQSNVPSPGQFDHVITAVTLNKSVLWMDSTPEVAPFRMLFSGLRDKEVLGIPNNSTPVLMKTPANPPFEAFSQYDGKATLAADGTLTARFTISLRGDDELLYRIGFHQTPRVQWQTLVQNVSYATGFAGTVSNIDASSPEQLAKPFQYSYDYTRKEYADWANRRILALMPPVAFAYGEDDPKPAETILLSGPVTYSFHSNIQLPENYSAELPSPVKLQTDFAEYSANYSQSNGSLIAERTLSYKRREIPVAQWDAYIKFEKSVQDDAGQFIQLIGSGAKLVSIRTPSNLEAAKLVQQAYADIRDRNFDAATRQLDQAKAINPMEWGLWSDYGYLDLSQGRRDDAVASYRKEIENHPENFDVYRFLAGNLVAFNRTEDAVEILRALLKADPEDISGHQMLASLLMRKKRFAEAVPVLQESVKLAPKDHSFQVMLGNAKISMGDNEAGIAILRGVLANPDNQAVLNDVAFVLADANLELPLARSSCEKALQQLDADTSKASLASLTDDDFKQVIALAATWDTMAWILYRQGELADAEGFAKAAWLLDQRPEIAFHLGQIYEKEGKKPAAIEMYRLAIAAGTGPYASEVDDARDRLKALASTEVSSEEKVSLGEKLGSERSIKFASPSKAKGSADFFVLFTPDPLVEEVQYVSGDATLKPFADQLKQASFNVVFPPGSHAKIVRRGILYCSEALKGCQFTMLLPKWAKRN